ncbi:MAG: helix-turn-helix domain-containing protein [Anaerolineales bacterium]|nr:helix-turn-helix domain-containing protein [Anaerolineales bacterium]
MTSKEFALLYLLAGHPGRVYNRAYLLDEIWGYEAENHDRTVDTHIYQLHQKINPVSETSRRILALRGIGSKFERE